VPIITLMTDFGMKDGNVGVMRGVILGICPAAQIVDVSHTIAPQNVQEAAYVAGRVSPYFPEGTVHVIVVDPGVGTQRRAIAARLGRQFFVCPDNGLITLPFEEAEHNHLPVEIVELDQPRYWLPVVSKVFHGRDIFAPSAAHLANGTALRDLGARIQDPVLLALPKPERTGHGWRGEVIHVDHFGNLLSNIRAEHLNGVAAHEVTVAVAGIELHGLVGTFGDRPAGELVALLGSTGSLIISEVNGSAAKRLHLAVGAMVEVTLA
jgi:hypothetical protein